MRGRAGPGLLAGVHRHRPRRAPRPPPPRGPPAGRRPTRSPSDRSSIWSAGHHQAKAAVELALLDAQLRAAGRSLADWLGATATELRGRRRAQRLGGGRLPAGSRDGRGAAGASRLRVKVGPGFGAAGLAAVLRAGRSRRRCCRRTPTARSRSTTQTTSASSTASTGSASPASSSRSHPDDLTGHARLAERLEHPDLPRRAADLAGRHRGGRGPGRLRGRLPQARSRRRLAGGPARARPVRRARGRRSGWAG